MNDSELNDLLSVARDGERDLRVRRQAIRELGLSDDTAVIPQLQRLMQRPKPGPEPALLNWDPAAAERVIDLHLIEALYRLGDESHLSGIARRVAAAGDILQGPDDERLNAAEVLLRIGRLKPIGQVVDLCHRDEQKIVANAVRTLQLLDLPRPPSGGPVDHHPGLSKKVSFEIDHLREELETIADLSEGSISLSEGVVEEIARRDYDRGHVQRKGMSLADIVTRDIDMLDFSYYTVDERVIVCTFREAGQRWLNKWPEYKKHLTYDSKDQRFLWKS